MKNFSTFALLFWSIFLYPQFTNPKIELKKDWKTADKFYGSVSGEPITLYLEYLNHSGWHDKVFTVQGWYYYDRYKEKIPLIGYYNGDLKLYSFGKNQQKFVEQIKTNDLFCWTEPCPEYSDYDEFMEIIQDTLKTQKGKLKIGNKQYNVKIKTDLLDITKRNEWLSLPNGKTYNLFDIIDGYGGNKVVSSFEDKHENRIMLYFERDSNFNKQGFCGATEPETGYRLLTFDKKWNVKKFQVYSTTSCIADVMLEKEMKTKYEFIKAYYLYYNDTQNLLIVNLKNSTFGTRLLQKNYDPYQHFWVR